jgi:hypothetical protein
VKSGMVSLNMTYFYCREDDSSEESKPSVDSTKDALSMFLMKSGIMPSKKKKQHHVKDASASTSSSEEEDDLATLEDEDELSYIPYKSSIEKKNEQLKEFLKLTKRKLAISEEHDNHHRKNKTHHTYVKGDINRDDLEDRGVYRRPVLFMSSSGPSSGENNGEEGEGETGTITGQIGSLVSSWVPWVSLSFGADSFEKDPFFTGGKKGKSPSASKTEGNEAWKKDLDKLAYLMKLKSEIERNKRARKKQARVSDSDNDTHEDGNPSDPVNDDVEDNEGENEKTVKMDGQDEVLTLSSRMSKDLKSSPVSKF